MRKQLFIAVCMLLIAAPWAAASTIAYWRFEEGPADGPVTKPYGALDSSGNGYDLDPWTAGDWAGFAYRTDVPLATVPQTGAANSFSVRNTGGYPGMATDSTDAIRTITPAAFTIEAMFKLENGGHKTIVGRDSRGSATVNGDNAALYFQTMPNNTLAIKFCDVQGYWHEAISAANIFTGFDPGTNPNADGVPWYYMAAISDGSTLSLYLANVTDGTALQLIAQNDMTTTPDNTDRALTAGTGDGGDWDAGNWTVGRGMWAGGHADRAFGFIDEVRISDVALGLEYLLVNSRIAAWNPTPVKGTANYGFTPDGTTVTVDLSWNTGMDPANPEQVNPAILKHYLYISKDQAEFSDPNVYWVADITAVGSTGQAAVTELNYDGQYLWRVDEAVDMGGGVPSPKDDPNTITGPIWSFGSLLSIPVVTQQPASALTDEGETVSFTVAANSLWPVEYQWFKAAGPVRDIENDQAIGSSSFTGMTLTLSNVQVADEGYYYCSLKNKSPNYVYSNMARLGIRRPVAHWTLDSADYVGGQYQDISGEGHHADPNGAPSFVTGQLGQGVSVLREFGEQPSTGSWASAGTWNPSAFSNQLTVSFWMKWAGLNGTWQGFITKRSASSWSNANVLWQISSDNGLPHLWFESPRAKVAVNNGLVADQWQYIVATYDGTTGTIYINGERRASGAFQLGDAVDALICLGGNSFELGGQEWMNGSLDDVKFFNYALTEMDVAVQYTADAPDKTACLQSQKPDVRFDLNNDCKVDIDDFAIFVEQWLDSGLIGGN